MCARDVTMLNQGCKVHLIPFSNSSGTIPSLWQGGVAVCGAIWWNDYRTTHALGRVMPFMVVFNEYSWINHHKYTEHC